MKYVKLFNGAQNIGLLTYVVNPMVNFEFLGQIVLTWRSSIRLCGLTKQKHRVEYLAKNIGLITKLPITVLRLPATSLFLNPIVKFLSIIIINRTVWRISKHWVNKKAPYYAASAASYKPVLNPMVNFLALTFYKGRFNASRNIGLITELLFTVLRLPATSQFLNPMVNFLEETFPI